MVDITRSEHQWNIGFVVMALLAFALGYVVFTQIRDTHERQLVIMEQVRVLRIELDALKQFGSPIADKRLSILELKVEALK